VVLDWGLNPGPPALDASTLLILSLKPLTFNMLITIVDYPI